MQELLELSVEDLLKHIPGASLSFNGKWSCKYYHFESVNEHPKLAVIHTIMNYGSLKKE
jgi:hypothetical protein